MPLVNKYVTEETVLALWPRMGATGNDEADREKK